MKRKKIPIIISLILISVLFVVWRTSDENLDLTSEIWIRTFHVDSPAELYIEVVNFSNRNIVLSGTPRLEQELYGQWYTVKEITYPATLYIDAGLNTNFLIPMDLPRGRYRVVMPFQCRRNSGIYAEISSWRFEIYEQVDLDITMEVLSGSISPWGAAFLVTNNSEFDLESVFYRDSDFIIEAYQDGEWSSRFRRAETTTALNLAATEQGVIAYTWPSRVSSDYPSRIVKYVRHVGENYTIWGRVYAEFETIPREIEDVGVVLEVTGVARSRHSYAVADLSLRVTNNSDYYAVFNFTTMRCYSYGYDTATNTSIMRNLDGRWVALWGYGTQRVHSFKVPPGRYYEFDLQVDNMDSGDFRIEKSMAIGLESPDTARTTGVRAEFSIVDFRMPEEMYGIHMRVSRTVNARMAIFELTNAFHEGTIYFNRDYRLQRYTAGTWIDVPKLLPDSLLDEEQFLGARQQRFIVKYWGWLYGTLETGHYRIVQSFWHHAPDGTRTQHDVYIEIGPFNHRHYLGINGGVISLAEVLREEHRPSPLASNRLLIQGIRADESGDKPRHRHDSDYSNLYGTRERELFENAHVVVFDAFGKEIRLSDIPQGAIVEIISSQSSPYGLLSVQIVDR